MTSTLDDTTRKLVSTNPSRNYEVLGEVAISSDTEIKQKIAKARIAQKKWWNDGLKERLKHVSRVRDLFQQKLRALAELTSKEMGMPISQSTVVVQRSVDYMTWCIDNAPQSLAPETTFHDPATGEINDVVREPHGVTAALSPWNFPTSNFAWACIQNLIAGNAVVFKNSEEVQLCAQEIEKIFAEAHFPQDVFNVVYGDGTVGHQLVTGDIDLICFTGSTKVGQRLYKIAGDKFIPALLEMGGSDPGIVFADANLEKAISTIYAGRFRNCGQVCCALKRLIVHESRIDDVIRGLSALLKTKIIGDALDASTDIGPLAAQRQLELLEAQVDDARTKGAQLLCGGKRPENLRGAYYEPTLLTNIKDDMRVWREEVFGPVLPLTTFKTYDEAIHLANDTMYGLGSAVYTEDKELAKQAARDIKAGMVQVNQTTYSKPCNPFGGYKCSGKGRENGKFGFHDVTQIKVIAREK